MKDITKYLIWFGIGLVALAGLINYFIVKNHNDKIVNDSLQKARDAKKAKAEERKEAREKREEQLRKEVDEELFNNELIEDIKVIKDETIKQK
tara:strand:+ start:1731 stop:2009 length:279 start_codon:yes stop_codon:yes gene_type:complete